MGFLQSFGEHALAVGFVMCFSPYQFEIGLCICYLLLYIFNLVKRFKYDGVSDVANTRTSDASLVVRIVNLGLLVCALVGISRCNIADGKCADVMY